MLAGFWPCQGKRHPQASWRRGVFRFRFGAAWHGSRAPMEERSADPILQGRGGSSGKATGLIKVVVQPGNHRLKLRVWSSTLEVKQMIRDITPAPVSYMRLLHNNVELINSQRLIDLVPTSKELTARSSGSSSSSRGSISRTLTLWLKVPPRSAPRPRVTPDHQPNRPACPPEMYPRAKEPDLRPLASRTGAKSKRL